mmetsp:Transcript_45620/g.145282  ORF Transcript_45620/g.145282 Transcript_45620/m.145282 type:complete len:260 (-) Transcript_45620:1588-2367(-)
MRGEVQAHLREPELRVAALRGADDGQFGGVPRVLVLAPVHRLVDQHGDALLHRHRGVQLELAAHLPAVECVQHLCHPKGELIRDGRPRRPRAVGVLRLHLPRALPALHHHPHELPQHRHLVHGGIERPGELQEAHLGRVVTLPLLHQVRLLRQVLHPFVQPPMLSHAHAHAHVAGARADQHAACCVGRCYGGVVVRLVGERRQPLDDLQQSLAGDCKLGLVAEVQLELHRHLLDELAPYGLHPSARGPIIIVGILPGST